MDNEYKDDKLLCPAEKKADLEIANQKLVVEYLADLSTGVELGLQREMCLRFIV